MMQKNSIKVNFAQGLDTKTDPKQIAIGNFLSLENTVFTNGGLLQKRNGFKQLPAVPANGNYAYLNTFNDDLTAIGNDIAAYSIPTNTWVQKGSYQPLNLSVLPVIRNNLNQVSVDIAVAPNGLGCVVYNEQQTNQNSTQYDLKFAIFDTVTGQNIVAPTLVPIVAGGTAQTTAAIVARVFILGTHFVIINEYHSGSGYKLQYLAIPYATPSSIGTPTDMGNTGVSSDIVWDAYVASNVLYFAYCYTVTPLIAINTLSSSLIVGTAENISHGATFISVCSDITGSTPVVYLNYCDTSNDSYMASFSSTLTPIMAPLQTLTSTALANMTASAQNGTCYMFYEQVNSYAYNTSIPTNLVGSVWVSSGAITSGPYVTLRGVGLASKSYIYQGNVYFLTAYESPYQPTYFLVPGYNTTGTFSVATAPNIIAKLAYGNGGGYLPNGLPSVPQSGDSMYFGYLFKDLLQAVSKATNPPAGSQVNGIYTQTGINMATVVFQSTTIDTEEIGNDLHISGGFLWMYDGYLPVEHNFFLWPDSIEAVVQSPVFTDGTVTNGSNIITAVSDVTDIGIGMTISGTDIPSGATVVYIGTNTITMSVAATGTNAGESISFGGSQDTSYTYYYQVTYEWSDNQGNIFRSAPSIPIEVTGLSSGDFVQLFIPTLRETLKTANPVKIVVYRWSNNQPEYYQATNVNYPLLNDTTVDYVSFSDPYADASILGDSLLYTTGGVVEDVNAPASNLFTLFDTRLWLVDAEDPNTVWYSKQVLEATPVEMSDLFTLYVPPSVGTSLNTGPITAITTMDDKLLMGKATSWVYINGIGPDNTGANSQYSQPIFVTSTVGCSNQASIVLSPTGLMFQSPSKGIWLMGRDLSVSYIGAPVESYVLGNTVTSAELMPGSTQVRFTMNTGVTLMYDYYYGQWATFNVNAESSCVFQGLHTYIDASQNVWQENPGSYLDGTTPVVMSFQTAPIRLGELDNYQRMYFFYLLGTYYSPHFLTLALTYDYGQSPSQTITIEPGAQVGITPGSLEAWRIFPMTQRCRAISLTLTESYDATLGPAAGQGLTLSGLNFVCGFKKPFVPTSSANSAG